MRPPSPPKPGLAVRLARTLLASLMACAVFAAAAPPGLTSGAKGCSMPCCQGAGGECAGGSCPVELPSEPQAPRPATEPASARGADAAAHAHHADARHDAHAPAAHHAHAPPSRSSGDGIKVEHEDRRHVSRRNTPPGTASITAKVSPPCPPDCGAAPSSFNAQPRPRPQAALTHGPRPRRLTPDDRARPHASVIKSSAARRGPAPTRGPPSATA